jgi:hypothetical protein
MRPVRHAALAALCAILLAPLPAAAESQSSNSSSNCSNGRCTRVDSMTIEDRYGRRGWVRHEAWRERDGRDPRGWVRLPRPEDWRAGRRWHRDDDDDDD